MARPWTEALLETVRRWSLCASRLTECSRSVAAARFAILGGVLVLAWFWRWSGVPLCLFHKFTGLDCPLCGCTRAFHAMCHGDATAAFSLNVFSPLLFVGVLLMMGMDALHVIAGVTPSLEVPERLKPWMRVTGVAALAVFVSYGVLRNLVAIP